MYIIGLVTAIGHILLIAVIKRSVRGMFNLLPEGTCGAVYRSVRWAAGRGCVYCGDHNLRGKDPHFGLSDPTDQ